MLYLLLLALCLAAAAATAPLALHQLVEVAVGGDVTITLKGYDLDNDSVRASFAQRKEEAEWKGRKLANDEWIVRGGRQ
jgi:hypothetical protein